MSDPSPFSRRRLLRALPAAMVIAALPWRDALARASSAGRMVERRLVIHHQHTGEWVRTVYFADGHYQAEGLDQINRILRDWRTDQVIAIDPKVLDIIHLLQQQLDLTGPLEVVCGYRSPATNALLRQRSHEVARNSLHMAGKAVDISFQGTTLQAVRQAATALGAGGVGYYPADGFIHLDSGEPRQWQQGGRGSRRTRARIARLRSRAASQKA